MGDFKFLSRILIVFSVICIILAMVGAFAGDIWLASTQWLLVAAVLAGFGVYAQLEE